jgi:TetR/AcrR family transcriptional repressor of nem operon
LPVLQVLVSQTSAYTLPYKTSPSGVNAICEFGTGDEELNQLNGTAGTALRAAMQRTLGEAVDQGQIPANTDISGACDFLLSTLNGMKVSAKGAMSTQQLETVARFATKGLSPLQDLALVNAQAD